ncbi:hypothetical protein [Bailinhaonella thermotolerans]|uniref:Uncharacterized protein n=1 Tax=Bailinhaonella thermotolerans TaxID=1070861 RepID=A0A3A3ZX69_9ACTN|nr:hypothetical protein [Bailinhaonella thermotolerans]RJL19278.1 hypothetical protein D5H75_40515 [Bailinhaonella thermotolerans]
MTSRLAKDATTVDAAILAMVTATHGPEAAAPQGPDLLAAAWAARRLASLATMRARQYVVQAREAGRRWEDIGQALCLRAPHDLSLRDVTLEYALCGVDAEGRACVTWRCPACARMVREYVREADPAAAEHGHAADCARAAGTR